MKIRMGFISNSSSCSFIIDNHTGQPRTLVDFLRDNPEIFQQYLKEFEDDIKHMGMDWGGHAVDGLTVESLWKSAAEYSQIIFPGRNYLTFEDDAGLAEYVLHSMLSEMKSSNKNWSWEFHESYH